MSMSATEFETLSEESKEEQMKYMADLINFDDFMSNDNNPTLVRLANQLSQDPKFQRIIAISTHYGKPYAECTEEEIQLFEDNNEKTKIL